MTLAATGVPSVTVRAPAKINLELIVGPRRADGYHDLATVFHAVSLYDEVTVEAAPRWSVEVRGLHADLVPADESNLAHRAAVLLAETAGVDQAVAITIDKQIPVAGGLAGGSADGAAALLACETLWGLGTPRAQLEALGARLGSDVPFALTGGTAIGSGRGERLAPVLGRGRYHWVLATSDTGLSTPAVYAECDRLRGRARVPAPVPSAAMMTALRSGDPEALGPALVNDLQEAALSLRPELGEVVQTGLEYGALGGVVSGSGPTVAFLVADHEAGLDLSVALTASGVAPTVCRATGPVHGAHVVSLPTPPAQLRTPWHPSRGVGPSEV
ncbi:MAG TPA: 4-(cytidine 5'-diphospho)-2-C-methyl-D-erythritol kinase [Dermatophilaceae bacterium]|nr:4-(cytidine 5'-diphospho)-2-C-methyl-D-erythritol kinase [Dermatophilaceae bacterium]